MGMVLNEKSQASNRKLVLNEVLRRRRGKTVDP
jgi:hypothetical protein